MAPEEYRKQLSSLLLELAERRRQSTNEDDPVQASVPADLLIARLSAVAASARADSRTQAELSGARTITTVRTTPSKLWSRRNPRTPQYRVRWGRSVLRTLQPGEAAKLYKKPAIDPKNAQAYLGLPEVLAEEFNAKRTKRPRKLSNIDPKLYQAHETDGAHRARR